MTDKVINDFPEKTTPVSGDWLLLSDSADTLAYKKTSIGDLLSGLSWVNEVMGFPAPVGIDIDLDANNQWWDKIDTPTTAVTMVDVAGESGITESYEYALKTITDASGEGFYQRLTYADQPRVKSGLKLSAIAAIWVGTAGRTVTMALTTSASTSVTATTSAQAWTILKCENLTLDGTYVDLKFTVDGADTFYVVPLGVNIGPMALRLPPRGLRYQARSPVSVLTLTNKGNEAAWTDIDLTSNASPLAAVAGLLAYLGDATDHFRLFFRRNGSTDSASSPTQLGGQVYGDAEECWGAFHIILDDSQVVEYYLDIFGGGSGTLTNGGIVLTSWWEWA